MNDLISRRALCDYALNQKDTSITPNDIMRFPSVEQWISCDKKLPERGTSYLITRYGRVEIAYYEGKDLWRGLQGLTTFKTDSVTAWCELPQPYRG